MLGGLSWPPPVLYSDQSRFSVPSQLKVQQETAVRRQPDGAEPAAAHGSRVHPRPRQTVSGTGHVTGGQYPCRDTGRGFSAVSWTVRKTSAFLVSRRFLQKKLIM